MRSHTFQKNGGEWIRRVQSKEWPRAEDVVDLVNTGGKTQLPTTIWQWLPNLGRSFALSLPVGGDAGDVITG